MDITNNGPTQCFIVRMVYEIRDPDDHHVCVGAHRVKDIALDDLMRPGDGIHHGGVIVIGDAATSWSSAVTIWRGQTQTFLTPVVLEP